MIHGLIFRSIQMRKYYFAIVKIHWFVDQKGCTILLNDQQSQKANGMLEICACYFGKQCIIRHRKQNNADTDIMTIEVFLPRLAKCLHRFLVQRLPCATKELFKLFFRLLDCSFTFNFFSPKMFRVTQLRYAE